MQSTGQTGGRHLPHPEHSSGMMITSMPWLKMAPNWGGQWRRQVSQLMHSDISIRNGTCFHFGLRSRFAIRSARLLAATGSQPTAGGGDADAAVIDVRPAQRTSAPPPMVTPRPATSAPVHSPHGARLGGGP